MGGFNQAQAHAQFVANIVDYGMDIQQALEAGRFTKATFAGGDVNVEALVPEPVRDRAQRARPRGDRRCRRGPARSATARR